MYIANEGKAIIIINQTAEKECLNFLRKFAECERAVTIGEILSSENKKVLMKSIYGGIRIVSMLSGEQLPRIC